MKEVIAIDDIVRLFAFIADDALLNIRSMERQRKGHAACCKEAAIVGLIGRDGIMIK